jgi:uncharacterized protein YaaQ
MSNSLKDFLKAFASDHTLTGGGELILVVTPEELASLGDFLVRGICGWALGLEAERARPRLIEVTRHTCAVDETASEGIAGEDIDEPVEEKEPVN